MASSVARETGRGRGPRRRSPRRPPGLTQNKTHRDVRPTAVKPNAVDVHSIALAGDSRQCGLRSIHLAMHTPARDSEQEVQLCVSSEPVIPGSGSVWLLPWAVVKYSEQGGLHRMPYGLGQKCDCSAASCCHRTRHRIRRKDVHGMLQRWNVVRRVGCRNRGPRLLIPHHRDRWRFAGRPDDQRRSDPYVVLGDTGF